MMRLLALLCCVFVIAAPVARAESPAQAPALLVSTSKFTGSPYARLVIIAARSPFGGHIGVIVNRPLRITLAEAFPEDLNSRAVRDRVHFGGYYMREALVALARSTERPAGEYVVAMAPGVWLLLDEAAIDQAIAKLPHATRFYVGFLRWQEGALAEMLEAGLFAEVRVDVAKVFGPDTSRLYDELVPGGANRPGLRPARIYEARR